MEERIYRAGEVSLHVTDWGGSGDTIFFAHPTGFLGAVWEPVIRILRESGCEQRLITFDQRGHGLSSKPDTGYQWPVFARDAEALLQSLDLRGALGVGHSGGGTTLACVAADNPQRFRRLLLIDPVLFHHLDDSALIERENPLARRTRGRRVVWGSREELFESLSERPPYESWTEEALRVYVERGTFERPDGEYELLCPSRLEAQVYQNGVRFDHAYLSRIEVNVVYLRGTSSDTFTAERAARAMEFTPRAELIEVPGAGHFVPMEKPALVAEVVMKQLESAD